MTSTLRWFKSSYSDSSGGDCVEISTCPHTTPTVHIRDSKTVPAAGPAHPRLAISADAWSAFLGWTR